MLIVASCYADAPEKVRVGRAKLTTADPPEGGGVANGRAEETQLVHQREPTKTGGIERGRVLARGCGRDVEVEEMPEVRRYEPLD